MASDGHDEISKEQREFSRRRFLRNAGRGGRGPTGLAGILSEQGASAATYKRNSDHAVFASHPKYHFVMVNHVTTNSFFTATIYGIQDACALTGCSYQWTGSASSIVNQMVSAFNTAIAAKANGIGCCLIDNTAFNNPVDTALNHGIPVIAYNADVSAGTPNNRLAYVGQNNLTAGAAVAQQILKQAKKGDLVAGIIATPGTGNIQPRIDGAKPVLAKAGINFVEVGTSATEGAPEYNKISAWYAGHKDVKFMFAGGQRGQRRPRAARPEEQPEGEGRRGGLGRRDAGRAGHRRRQPDLHDRPAGLPAGLRHDHAALPVQRLGWADEADQHRHGTRHRGQGDRRAVPGDRTGSPGRARSNRP